MVQVKTKRSYIQYSNCYVWTWANCNSMYVQCDHIDHTSISKFLAWEIHLFGMIQTQLCDHIQSLFIASSTICNLAYRFYVVPHTHNTSACTHTYISHRRQHHRLYTYTHTYKRIARIHIIICFLLWAVNLHRIGHHQYCVHIRCDFCYREITL